MEFIEGSVSFPDTTLAPQAKRENIGHWTIGELDRNILLLLNKQRATYVNCI